MGAASMKHVASRLRASLSQTPAQLSRSCAGFTFSAFASQ